jgi:hypothetical protein
MTLGNIRRLAVAGLAALMLLTVPAPVASAKLGGFMEGWFNRGGPNGDLPGRTDDLLAAAKNSGAQIARFNVQWCALEPSEGSFPAGPWNTVIAQMEQIMANNMRPLPIVISAPVWARPLSDRPSGSPTACQKKDERDNAYPPDDAHLPDWNQFIGRFIRCMRGIGDAGLGCPAGVTPPLPRPTPDTPGGFEARTRPIQGYEIWNEPNLGSYWGTQGETVSTGDADRFAKMVKAAFVLKHDRPVVLGGLSFPHDDGWDSRRVGAIRYINRVYNFFSDAPQFDSIGIHPYGNYLHTNAVDARDRFFDFRATVRNDPPDGHGDNVTQIWVTEVGDDGCPQSDWDVRICSGAFDPQLQSQRLVNMWTPGGPNEIPVPVIIYYRLMDSPDFDGQGKHMGVLPFDQFSNPRPAYCDLAAQWGASPSIC